jgi:hypothetical protein
VTVAATRENGRPVATRITLGAGLGVDKSKLPAAVKSHLKKQFPGATPVKVRAEGNYSRVTLRFKDRRSIDVLYRNARTQRRPAPPQGNATVSLQGEAFWLWPTGGGYAVGQFTIATQDLANGSFTGTYADFPSYASGPIIRGTISGNRITFDVRIGPRTLHFDGTVTTNVGDDKDDSVQGTLNGVTVSGHDGFIW